MSRHKTKRTKGEWRPCAGESFMGASLDVVVVDPKRPDRRQVVATINLYDPERVSEEEIANLRMMAASVKLYDAVAELSEVVKRLRAHDSEMVDRMGGTVATMKANNAIFDATQGEVFKYDPASSDLLVTVEERAA